MELFINKSKIFTQPQNNDVQSMNDVSFYLVNEKEKKGGFIVCFVVQKKAWNRQIEIQNTGDGNVDLWAGESKGIDAKGDANVKFDYKWCSFPTNAKPIRFMINKPKSLGLMETIGQFDILSAHFHQLDGRTLYIYYSMDNEKYFKVEQNRPKKVILY
ncbi:hypothetical protein DICPUDRAFT_40278 [Dictyostelium purpureum]|uniref:Uncharacterized protein n=1 Tax=Dictyostelium purpureum TaxID=5786 RepID=F0ZXX8_DICPU|nr:uncharacterized protein DICPUDRAFT_40278 [Dictyostelium purpureum]EGC31213.1 hypothetical protein DICPUDRAFT_40278 [Dictyostelium purpureum]|eukprot:XP_003292273.1 hypothetical protein DICPUDRAFT_40278 [Dictyostelium purpureum]